MKSNQMHKFVFYLCLLWVIYMAGYCILGLVQVMQNCLLTRNFIFHCNFIFIHFSSQVIPHLLMYCFLFLLSYKCGHMNHSHVSNYNNAKGKKMTTNGKFSLVKMVSLCKTINKIRKKIFSSILSAAPSKHKENMKHFLNLYISFLRGRKH